MMAFVLTCITIYIVWNWVLPLIALLVLLLVPSGSRRG